VARPYIARFSVFSRLNQALSLTVAPRHCHRVPGGTDVLLESSRRGAPGRLACYSSGVSGHRSVSQEEACPRHRPTTPTLRYPTPTEFRLRLTKPRFQAEPQPPC
jgi:hypothetical protein